LANTPLAQKKFLRLFGSSWLVWACVHAYVLYSLGAGWPMAFADSAISNILLCGACVLISNNLQYYMPKKERYWYILSISVFIAAVAWAITKYSLQFLPTSDAVYKNILQQSFTIRYCVMFLLTAFMAVISVLWYTFEQQQKETKRENETAKLAKEAELFNLRQQLQPHFLFNSLNSINALIGARPAEARTMLQQLSSFLRSTLTKDENQWVALKDELEQLGLYLSIEKVRFGNRLQTIIKTEDAALQLQLPALLLQPLLENAIKFGLYGTTGETTIELHANSINNQLVIAIINPFDKDSAPDEKGTGFGLNSVKRRLYLLFARNDLVETEINNNQFIASVTIPQPIID
jgi:two-component system, LytTR family, sensor kinase